MGKDGNGKLMAPNFTPTLIIGLGGSGTKVVDLAKHYIAEKMAMFNWPARLSAEPVQYMAVDTDTRQPLEYLDNLRERMIISAGDLKMIYENNRYVKGFWPESGYPASGDTTAGCSAIRLRGRVCFYKNVDDMVAKIRAKKEELSHYADTMGLNLAQLGGIRLIIVGSCCGGTGSSSILDLATLCRDAKLGLFGVQANITGILFLPDTFEARVAGSDLDRVYANSYATLQELEYAMDVGNIGKLRFNYSSSYNQITIEAPLFTECYLVGTHSSRDVLVATSPDALFDLVAADIAERITTHESVYAAAASQAHGILSKYSIQGNKPRVFSSFGTKVVVYPLEAAAGYWESKLKIRILDELLGNTIKEEVCAGECDDFINNRAQIKEFGDDQILNFLNARQDVQAAAASPVNIGLFRSFGESAIGTEVEEKKSMVNDHLGRLAGAMAKGRNDKLTQVLSDLDKYLQNILRTNANGCGGVRHAIRFLETLSARVQVHSDDIDKEARKLEKERSDSLLTLNGDEKEIQEARKAFFVVRTMRIRESVSEWVEDLAAFYRKEYDLQLRRTATAIFTYLNNTINDLLENLKVLELYLGDLRRAFDGTLQSNSVALDRLFLGEGHDISLYAQKDFEALLDKIGPAEKHVAPQLAASPEYYGMIVLPKDERLVKARQNRDQNRDEYQKIRDSVISNSQKGFLEKMGTEVGKRFAHYYTKDILELALQDLGWNDDQLKERIGKCAMRGDPLCEIQSELAEQCSVVFLVGIHNGAQNTVWPTYLDHLQSLFSNAKVSYTAHENPRRIIISLNVHGYPLFCFKRITRDGLRHFTIHIDQIKKDTKGRYPWLHILREWPKLPAIELRHDREIMRLYALGLAFGRRTKDVQDAQKRRFIWFNGSPLNGKFYAWQRNQDETIVSCDPYDLGQGREASYNKYMTMNDAHNDLRYQLETLIQAEGHEVVQTELKQYILQILRPLYREADLVQQHLQKEEKAIRVFIEEVLDYPTTDLDTHD